MDEVQGAANGSSPPRWMSTSTTRIYGGISPGADIPASLHDGARLQHGGRTVPTDPRPLWRQIVRGVRETAYDKPAIFDPKAITAINYYNGRHAASPTGHVVHEPQRQVKLLHYKCLGVDYVCSKSRTLRRPPGEDIEAHTVCIIARPAQTAADHEAIQPMPVACRDSMRPMTAKMSSASGRAGRIAGRDCSIRPIYVTRTPMSARPRWIRSHITAHSDGVKRTSQSLLRPGLVSPRPMRTAVTVA